MDIKKELESFKTVAIAKGWSVDGETTQENYRFYSLQANSGWEMWQAAKAKAVQEGFVLIEREKLAMIFETATNALVYHEAPPKHSALSIIQGIARKTMIETKEKNQ